MTYPRDTLTKREVQEHWPPLIGWLRELPKGDALATAQVAGIMAAKRTSDLIPLCHPLPLSNVEVSLEIGAESVEITSVVETTAQTGVEMEALAAVSVAALTAHRRPRSLTAWRRADGIAAAERSTRGDPGRSA